MPTVLRVAPYRFFLGSVDLGEPRHVHVRRGDSVAKFWLDPVALQEAGGYSRPELDAIEAIVNDHRDELLEGWFDFYGHI